MNNKTTSWTLPSSETTKYYYLSCIDTLRYILSSLRIAFAVVRNHHIISLVLIHWGIYYLHFESPPCSVCSQFAFALTPVALSASNSALCLLRVLCNNSEPIWTLTATSRHRHPSIASGTAPLSSSYRRRQPGPTNPSRFSCYYHLISRPPSYFFLEALFHTHSCVYRYPTLCRCCAYNLSCIDTSRFFHLESCSSYFQHCLYSWFTHTLPSRFSCHFLVLAAL